MKNRYLLLLLLNCAAIATYAQPHLTTQKPIRLKTGLLTPANNLQKESADGEVMKPLRFKENYYTLIQFNKVPTADEKKQLAQNGILLFDYLPDNAYLAQVKSTVAPANLSKYNVTGV